MEDLDDLITLAEAAEDLGIAPVTLRAAIARGRFAARKFGQTWVTSKTERDRYRREQLGQVGRPANILDPNRRALEDVLGTDEPNLLDPHKDALEDVLGRPGEPNILEDLAPDKKS